MIKLILNVAITISNGLREESAFPSGVENMVSAAIVVI
jgi:hypothetical protein